MREYKVFLMSTGSAFVYQAALRDLRAWKHEFQGAARLARIIASLPKENVP